MYLKIASHCSRNHYLFPSKADECSESGVRYHPEAIQVHQKMMSVGDLRHCVFGHEAEFSELDSRVHPEAIQMNLELASH